MMKKPTKRSIALAVSATLAASAMAHANSPSENTSLLNATTLEGGYLQFAMGGEGKCGEGKCGDAKGDKEGKCGEGKCGDAKDDKGKDDKGKEGKCGEGKCGGA